MKIFRNPSGIYVVITLFIEHDPLIWLGLRQNGMYYTTMRLIVVPYNLFIHKVCFTSVYVNFTDLTVFVELGTGVRNWGRMGPLHLGFQDADGKCEYKNLTCK